MVAKAPELDLGDISLPDPGLRPSTLFGPAAPTPTPEPAPPTPAPTATPVAQKRDVTVRPPLRDMVQESPKTDVADASRAAIGRAAARKALRQRLDAIADFAKRGDVQRARLDYQELARTFSRSEVAPEALYRAAELLKNDPEKRLSEYYSIVELHPGSPWAQRSVGEVGHLHATRGEWRRAADAYLAYESVTKEPLPREREMEFIRALVEIGALKKASQRIATLQKQEPGKAGEPDLLALKNHCLVGLGRYGEATQSLREFVLRNRRHQATPGALLSLALCFEELGRIDDAKQAYQLLLEFFPPGNADAPPESALARRELHRLTKPLF